MNKMKDNYCNGDYYFSKLSKICQIQKSFTLLLLYLQAKSRVSNKIKYKATAK